MNRRFVSLGGWCGPSLMLSKLGLRGEHPPLPYDMVRCTMDGMALFNGNGFDGYFPPATEAVDADILAAHERGDSAAAHFFTHAADPSGLRIRMDPVSIWLLFRGMHTAFTHFDLNLPAVRTELQRRIDAWHRMMDDARRGAHPPVLFLRTCLASDPADEIRALAAFQRSLDEASGGRLDYRIALALHDQGPETRVLGTAGDGDRCLVWNLAFTPGAADRSLFDKAHDGYEQILRESGDDARFRELLQRHSAPAAPSPGARAWAMRDHLAKVEGVPAFRGTCTGFGSTITAAMGGICVSCGTADEHALAPAPEPAAWSEDEDATLAQTLALSGNPDIVACIEQLSQQLQRPAGDVLAHTQQLVREGNL